MYGIDSIGFRVLLLSFHYCGLYENTILIPGGQDTRCRNRNSGGLNETDSYGQCQMKCMEMPENMGRECVLKIVKTSDLLYYAIGHSHRSQNSENIALQNGRDMSLAIVIVHSKIQK